MNIDELKKSFFGYQKASVCRYVSELEKTRAAQDSETKKALEESCREIVNLKRQLYDCKAENEQLRKELAESIKKQSIQAQQEDMFMRKQREQLVRNIERYLKSKAITQLPPEEHNLALFEKQESMAWKK